MRPVTQRFLSSLRYSHLVAASCDLYFPGSTTPTRVPVEGGAVTIDRTAQIRRTGSVQIPWSLDVGMTLGLDLRTLPFGGYALLQRGIRYPDGTTELCLLGRLRVESVSWRTTEDTASLELADRMAQVRDEPFTTPYVPLTGTPISRNGTLTDLSNIITGLAQTSDLLVGMTVRGIGFPAPTTITVINSASQITVSTQAQLYEQKDLKGLPNYPILSELNTTADLSVGMDVDLGVNDSGQALARPGTKILSVDSDTQITLNQPTANVTFRNPGKPGGYARATFTAPAVQPLSFGGGIRIAQAAIEVVQQVFGTQIGYRKLYDPAIITSDVYFSQSRSDTLGELSAAAAGDNYFDANGDYVFDGPPGQTAPVWTVDTGLQGVLVDANEALDRTGVYNGVLIQGQQNAGQAPVSALVVDSSTGPARWGGPFGKVARIESSTAVQTQAQAQAAAQVFLNGRLGLSRSLVFSEVPNPALEASDVITVLFADGRSERHLVDSVRIDLGPEGAQELTTRSIYTPAQLNQQVPLPTERTSFYGAAAWAEINDARTVTA